MFRPYELMKPLEVVGMQAKLEIFDFALDQATCVSSQ